MESFLAIVDLIGRSLANQPYSVIYYNIIDQCNLSVRFAQGSRRYRTFRIHNRIWHIVNAAAPQISDISYLIYLSGSLGQDGSHPYLALISSHKDALVVQRDVLAALLHFARGHNLTWRLLPSPERTEAT